MRPRFRLDIAGNDVTDKVSDRVISIKVNDEAGQKSDTLDVTLDDRDNLLSIPEARAEMQLWLGYDDEDLTYMGRYTIDEVSLKTNPDTMTVRGKAADSSPEFKAAKTRSWHQQTIGEIITAIAEEHALVPAIHVDYVDELIDHIDQENESDAHFMTRLGKLYGAVAKPADGRLLFIPEGQGISTSGQTLSAAIIEKDEITSLSATVKERGQFSGVITRFRDKESNREIEVETTEAWQTRLGPAPVFRDKKLYTSRDMAEQAGKAQLDRLRGGTVQIDFTMPGRPDLFAERPIKLEGFRSPLTGEWIAKTVSHTFASSGLTTKVSAGSRPD
ncbi:MAG: hypothetical protein CL844_05020 [Crocinitomicaceae bacterium]|nr:hypothetical protein [Crocinitomicaceae bacterium]|tara:strand:- start:3481 stop:4473 length:993 start_codon:yes stop_codon:yes gene_type:complete